MKKWQDPSLTLGKRCVAFAENELANGVAEDKPNSYTSPRIREYFKICTRNFNGKEVPIGLNFPAGNWCAAAGSFCLQQSLLPGEQPPHHYRLGVVGIIADMERQGTYHPLSEALSGAYQLKVGDAVFWDRSRPNEPATAWYRHFGRIYSISTTGFESISGNSGGKWRIAKHTLKTPQLLGFGSYDQVGTPNVNVPIDWDNVKIEDLAPMEDTGTGSKIEDIWDIFDDVFDKHLKKD